MTAARPTTSRQEIPNNEADPADPSQESQHPTNSEPTTDTIELIE